MSQLADPSLLDESVEIHQTEKVCKIDNKITSFTDVIMVRHFKTVSGFKVQLTSQNNISFFYICHLDEVSTEKLALHNQLNIQFSTLSSWLRHMFSTDFIYQLILKSKTHAQLRILKQQKFKNYLVVVIPFEQAPQDIIQMSLTYRYQRMKHRKQILGEYWEKMNSIIKTKNPSLFMALEQKKQKKVFK